MTIIPAHLKKSILSDFGHLFQVFVHFTPTIPHCSMATLIGLAIRVKLLRSLPPRFKVSKPLNLDKLCPV